MEEQIQQQPTPQPEKFKKKASKTGTVVGIIILVILAYIFIPDFFSSNNTVTDVNLHSFSVNYPIVKSSFEKNDVTVEGIRSIGYLATMENDDGAFTYNVIINEHSDKILSDEAIETYLGAIPENMLTQYSSPILDYTKRIAFQNKYEGVEYQFTFIEQGITVYNRGIHFVIGGNGMHLSVLGITSNEEYLEKEFNEFINSFSI